MAAVAQRRADATTAGRPPRDAGPSRGSHAHRARSARCAALPRARAAGVLVKRGCGGNRRDAGACATSTSAAGAAARADAAWDPERVVSFSARSDSSHRLRERARPLAEYMALPASQYSVLDARRVERLDADTFVCYVGALRFFQFSVEPVLTLRVDVVEGGCEICLLSCRIQGSRFVEQQNSKFSTTMKNSVRWRDIEGDDAHKELVSNIELNQELEVPRWLPKAAVKYTGARLLQGILNAMVPSFLKQLEDDYTAWSDGDDSRQALGELVSMADDV